MPTTRYSEENLTFFPSQEWNTQWQPQIPVLFYPTFPQGSTNSRGSTSESEFSAPETPPESSNSPLRSPDTTTPEDVAVGAGPFLQLVEPPVESCRFRYPTEMKGTHGSILGISSTRKENARKRIFPAVKLCNYRPAAPNEKVIIRCTLTTADENEADRIPHVHVLKGKGKTSRSPYKTVEIDDPIDNVVSYPSYQATFGNMTILYIKKDDQLKELLKKKKRHIQEMYTDPDENAVSISANTNEDQLLKAAQNEIGGMNLNRLNTACLKFEALRGGIGQLIYEPIPNCQAIYTKPIKNIKSAQFNELRICRIDKTAGTCLGREEVFIFVEKVNKKDIKVRFYELNEFEEEVWHAYAELGEEDVHFQYAIAFRTPRYRDVEIDENVKVYFQLERPSNGSRSAPKEFEYIPDSRRWQDTVRKRRRLESPPIPITVHDFSRPSTSTSSTWPDSTNLVDLSVPIFAPTAVAAPSGSSDITMASSEDRLTELSDLLKDFPEFIDIMESEEEDISTVQQSPSLNLSSFSSGDSDLILQAFASGVMEKWADCNGVSGNLIQEIRSKITGPSDLVTDGVSSLNIVKPERWTASQNIFKPEMWTASQGIVKPEMWTASQNINEPEMEPAVNIAYHQSGLSVPRKWQTGGHKGLAIKVQPYNQSRNQLTRDNIVSKVSEVLNTLLKLKKNGKIQDKDLKHYLLKIFATSVGENYDRVFHILASFGNFPMEILKFLNILKICGIAEKVVNLKNTSGQTALHVAAEKGSLQTIAQLVESGADVNARDRQLNTPVHVVANRSISDAFHAVGHLLEKNPDLSIYNADGLTALHLFVMNRTYDVIPSLIVKQEHDNYPVDIINQGDRKQGNTALHIAVQRRFREIVSLLLNFDHRIDVNAMNFEDKTPLAYVCEESNDDALAIKELLLASNADPLLAQGRRNVIKDEINDSSEDEMEEDNDVAQETSNVLHKVDEIKEEIHDNSGDENEDSDADKSHLPSHALDWKSEAELRLMDTKTISLVCCVLDENKNWIKLLKKFDFDEDMYNFLKSKWSPSLYLLKSIAELMPHVTSVLLRDMLMKVNPECKIAAQFIDDMFLCNMGVFS